jgi:hypothetical protein
MKHYLSANAESEIPSNLLLVSTASTRLSTGPNTIDLSLRCWVARHVRLECGRLKSNTTHHGNTVTAWWNTVNRIQTPKKPLWIVAHNALHTYTQLGLWGEMDSGEIATHIGGSYPVPPWYTESRPWTGVLCPDGLPFILRCRNPYGTVWMVDMLNYWQATIADLTEMLGDYAELDDCDGLSEDGALHLAHCRASVLQKSFVRLLLAWRAADLGNWKPTAAGLSMASFRHLVCDAREKVVKGIERFNILIDRDHEAIPLEREAYRGGRVEAFYTGPIPSQSDAAWREQSGFTQRPHGPIYLMDVRSMYPRIMSTHLYPCERVGGLHTGSIDDSEQLLRTHEIVAECLINSWTDTYPLTYEGRQIHAAGRYWTVLCGDELRRALANRHVERMGQTQLYRTAPLFAEWARLLVDMRTEYTIAGSKGMSDLCKLVANSLHGKFAQRPRRWTLSPGTPIRRRWGRWYTLDADSGESHSYRAIAGVVQEQTEGREGDMTFPAISAVIAANAREWLRTLILVCPPKSVLYVATDSLLVTQAGYDALTSRANQRIVGHGRLSLKQQAEYGYVHGQGYYAIGEDEVCSGPFSNAVRAGNGTWTTQLWSQAARILTQGPEAELTGTDTEWCEPECRPKGIQGDDGWITPHTLIPTPECLQLTPAEQRRHMARMSREERTCVGLDDVG